MKKRKNKNKEREEEIEKNKNCIVAKALDGQRYPLPPYEFMWMCGGKRGSGPKGADDLCLVRFEDLSLNLIITNGI